MNDLLDRPDVNYPFKYGRKLSIDDAKKYIGKDGEEIRVLEKPICFIRNTTGEKFHETIKYYSVHGFTYERVEDGSAWGGFYEGYTAEFEDGTIWKAPKIEPGIAFFNFMEEHFNVRNVILQDEDEDFVV